MKITIANKIYDVEIDDNVTSSEISIVNVKNISTFTI